jgi:hypothetical protein
MPPKAAPKPKAPGTLFSAVRMKFYWATYKTEAFFAFIAIMALGQVVRRELIVNKVVSAEELGYQRPDPKNLTLQAERVRSK